MKNDQLGIYHKIFSVSTSHFISSKTCLKPYVYTSLAVLVFKWSLFAVGFVVILITALSWILDLVAVHQKTLSPGDRL